MDLSYRDVLEQWDRSRAFGDPRDFSKFTGDLETLHPGKGYGEAARREGWWTRASTRADEYFFEPIAKYSGLEAVGGAVGDIFGAEEAGKRVARGLPRTLLQTVPAIFGGPPGVAASAGLFGAQSYAETGSPTQAFISGATAGALPYVGKYFGGLGARAFGAPIEEGIDAVTGKFFSGVIPKTATHRIGRALGAQAGMIATLEASEAASSQAEGRPFQPFAADMWLQQIPYTLLDIYGAVKAPKKVTPITREEPPAYRPPPGSTEHSMAIGEAIDHYNGVINNELASAEDKSAAFEMMTKVALDPESLVGIKLPDQLSLRKQKVSAAERSPFETSEEFDQRTGANYDKLLDELKANGQTEPETLENIMDRTERVQNPAIRLSDGRIVESPRPEQVTADVEKGWFTNHGNFVDDNTKQWMEGANDIPEPREIAKTAIREGADARQATSAAVEATSTAKQDSARVEKKKIERGLGKATLIRNIATGKTGFPDEATAQRALDVHLATNPAEAEGFNFRIAKRGKETVVRMEPKKVTFQGGVEAHVGETTADVTGGEPIQEVRPQVDIKDLPQIAYDRYVAGFEKLKSQPSIAQDVFAADSPGEALRLIDQFSTILWGEKEGKSLEAINKLLPADRKFKNQEAYDAVKEAGLQVMSHLQGYRQFDLGSKVPVEPKWQQEMDRLGWFRPDGTAHQGAVSNVLNWYANHKDTPEPIRLLFQSMMKAQPPEGVTLTTKPELGDLYEPTNNINVSGLPHNEVEAHRWARQVLGHEYFHYTARGIWYRNDPAAVRFRAETTNILQALRKSSAIPEKVRAALGKAPGWYEEYLKTGDSRVYQDRLEKAIGKDLASEWAHVFYGLSHEQELTAMAFSSPKMLDVMAKTQMPTKPMTVLQYFSQVWNKLFGGGANTDNALAQFLTAYDNYLSGPKVPSLYEFLRPQLSAGQGFLYGLAPYDPQNNVLGGKHTLPKGGVVPVGVLKNIGGVGKPLSDGEIELYRTIVPEAFGYKTDPTAQINYEAVKQDKVNIPKLVEGLKTRGPVVETKKIGLTPQNADAATSARAQLGQLQHQIETAGYAIETGYDADETYIRHREADPMATIDFESPEYKLIPQNVRDMFEEYGRLRYQMNEEPETLNVAKYSYISPKPENQMEGYVEGLVRIPTIGQKAPYAAAQGLRKGTLYAGPHFGAEDRNVLSFYRGYEETLPSGEKAFHVIEVQSDWGQQQRRMQEGGRPLTAQAEGHPLLSVYNQLALKAAIQHARDIGATKVILSDAETAMMTEGHDVAPQDMGPPENFHHTVVPPERFDEIDKFINDQFSAGNRDFQHVVLDRQLGVTYSENSSHYEAQSEQRRLAKALGLEYVAPSYIIPQDKGMRLNYDQILPSEMKKLTGDGGERVNLGQHQMTMRNIEPDAGSPVFKEPTGEPKTSITGRMYDLSKVASEFTLFEPKIPALARTRTYGSQDFIRDSLITKGARAEALMSRITSIQNFYNTGRLEHLVNGFQREADAGILPAMMNKGEINDLVKNALLNGTPKDIGNYVVSLLKDEVPIHSDMWWQLNNDVNIANSLHNVIKRGQIPGEPRPDFEQSMKDTRIRLDRMKLGLRKQQVALERYNQLDNFSHDGFARTIAGQFSGMEKPQSGDPTPLHDQAWEALGWFAEKRRKIAEVELEKSPLRRYGEKIFRYVGLVQHVKETMPEARDALDHISFLAGHTVFRMDEINAAGLYDPTIKDQNPNILKDVKGILKDNSPLGRVASDILLYAQTAERAGKKVTFKDPYIKERLDRYGPKLKTYLEWRDRRRTHLTDVTVAQQVYPMLHQMDIATVILGGEPGMRSGVAEGLGSEMYMAIRSMQDPNSAAFGAESLKTLATKMRPETFGKALQLSKDLVDNFNKHYEFMKSRPWYVSEMRLGGEHTLRMTTPEGAEKGKLGDFLFKYPTKAKALEARDELVKKGYKFVDYKEPSFDEPTRGLNEEVIARMEEMDNFRAERLTAALQDRPEVLQAILPFTQAANDYVANRKAFEPLPVAGFPRRKFAPGREQLNMVQNDYTSSIRYNNYFHHKLLRTRTQLDMMDPDLMTNPSARKYVQQHANNMLKGESPVARALSEFAYNWKVGGNFGVNALHFVQSFNTGITELIAQTGGVGSAFKYLMKAQKEVWQYNTTRKWATDELDWLDRYSRSRGRVGRTSWEGDIFDRDRSLQMEANSSPWMQIPNTLKWAARSWNGMFFRYNDRLGTVSAYMLGLDRGMSREQAAEFAWNVKDKWAFTGGKAQRAVGLWSIKTTAVPQLMTSLQTYVQGWFSELALNYMKGYSGMSHMTPKERVGARKAFLYQIGFGAVVAGALGLPGVGQGMALVKQATGVDVMSWLRQHLSDFFNEDEAGGGFWTTLALHGGMARFTPIDLSGRHMPSIPFIGVSPYNGFDLSQLAGAPLSTASDMVKGILSAAKGEVNLNKIMPEVLRGPAALFEGEGDVRDTRGRIIAQASPSERFIMALGMKPSRITNIKDINKAAQEASSRASKKKQHSVGQIADQFSRNPAVARQQLMQYLQEHPEDNGQLIVSAIAHHIADKEIPYDWRRHVNAAADVTGLTHLEPSSELQRRSRIYQVEQGFGMMPRFNPMADMEASELDAMMNADGEMTLARAKQQQRQAKPKRFSILGP